MFLKKISEKTDNKFPFVRIKEVVFDRENFSVEMVIVVPYNIDYKVWNDDVREELEKNCRELMPDTFAVSFRYVKSTLDEDIIKRVVKNYFVENNKALIGQIDEENIAVNINKNIVKITLPCFDCVCDYMQKSGIVDKLTDYLNRNFVADKININLVKIGKQDTKEILVKQEDVYIDRGIVNISAQHALKGSGIDSRPRYISRYDKPKDSVCICGSVSGFTRRVSKTKGYVFYNFTLDDTTGTMDVIVFTRSKKKACLDCVENDQYLVVEGKLEQDDYRKGLCLFADKVDYCKIDFDEMQANMKASYDAQKKKNKSYPMPYHGSGNANLMDFLEETCDLLNNRDVVVFDLETTGLDQARDRIIEIGAVKLVKGEIVSYYSTMVDPKMLIPPAASSVNNIYDKDVADAPYIEDCLPDFMDYCKGCVIVAHNAGFDVGFVKRECTSLGLSFDNMVYDSLQLAQKAFPGFGRYNLGFLCKKLGIELNNAHRAYFDAEATARLFIKEANKLQLK